MIQLLLLILFLFSFSKTRKQIQSNRRAIIRVVIFLAATTTNSFWNFLFKKWFEFKFTAKLSLEPKMRRWFWESSWHWWFNNVSPIYPLIPFHFPFFCTGTLAMQFMSSPSYHHSINIVLELYCSCPCCGTDLNNIDLISNSMFSPILFLFPFFYTDIPNYYRPHLFPSLRRHHHQKGHYNRVLNRS